MAVSIVNSISKNSDGPLCVLVDVEFFFPVRCEIYVRGYLCVLYVVC